MHGPRAQSVSGGAARPVRRPDAQPRLALGPHASAPPGRAATARAIAPQLRLLRSLGYSTHVIELPGCGAGRSCTAMRSCSCAPAMPPTCAPRTPGADIHIARGVGHMLTPEAAPWVNRHIARFAPLEESGLRRAN